MDIETLSTLVSCLIALQVGIVLTVVLQGRSIKRTLDALDETDSSVRALQATFDLLCTTGDDNAKAIAGIKLGLETRWKLERLRRDEDLAAIATLTHNQGVRRMTVKLLAKYIRDRSSLDQDEIQHLVDAEVIEAEPASED